jgi:tRNA-uridine 2-sulfurtransferase
MSNTVQVAPSLPSRLEEEIPPRLDEEGRPVRCLLMYSGGLDSTLAGVLLRLQGIEVVAVNMSTGFCLVDHKRKMGHRRKDGSAYRNEAIVGAKGLQIPVDIVDVSEGYLEVLTRPKYGWGSAVNPCIDCRIHMLRHARELLEEYDAHFVATGEVLGQRPMTQMKRQMTIIERDAELEGMVVRPLCQAALWETIPEQRGWVDRSKLLKLQGRGRKTQIAMAREHGILDFPQPAGGCCFLTDGNYGKRLKDVIEHKDRDDITFDDVLLLKLGRHFRLPGGSKLVVGRNHDENVMLETYLDLGISFRVRDHTGPRSLFMGPVDSEDFELAMRITARYSDAPSDSKTAIVEDAGQGLIPLGEVLPYPSGDENPWKIH